MLGLFRLAHVRAISVVAKTRISTLPPKPLPPRKQPPPLVVPEMGINLLPGFDGDNGAGIARIDRAVFQILSALHI